MSKAWFYTKNGQPQDAVTEEQLRALVGSGDVRGEDLVWSEGMSDWQPANRFPQLLPEHVSTSTRLYCARCGSPSDPQAHFCENCGGSLSDPAQPVQTEYAAASRTQTSSPQANASVDPLKNRKFSFEFRRAAIALGLACVAAIGGAWFFLQGKSGTENHFARSSATVHASLNMAIAHAFAEARRENRKTFYPVALWKDTEFGRGVVLAAMRRNDPVHGDCQEYVVSFITDEKLPVIADFGQVACKHGADGAYTVHPEIPVAIDDARRQSARSLMPPATLAVGSAWPILNAKQARANSQVAAIAMALNSDQVPATVVWEGVESRGALYVYASKDSPNCRKVISKANPAPASGRQFGAGYCPYSDGPIAGWIRTTANTQLAAELAEAEPLLDQAIGSARWTGVTQFPP